VVTWQQWEVVAVWCDFQGDRLGHGCILAAGGRPPPPHLGIVKDNGGGERTAG